MLQAHVGPETQSAPFKESNSPAAVQLAQEMEQRGAEARERVVFLANELQVWQAVESACQSALQSLNGQRDVAPGF